MEFVLSLSERETQMNVHEKVDLLTIREVARQLRVDDTTVRRWIKNGVLEAIVLPHGGARQAYRVRRSTLDALLASPSRPEEEAALSGANSHGIGERPMSMKQAKKEEPLWQNATKEEADWLPGSAGGPFPFLLYVKRENDRQDEQAFCSPPCTSRGRIQR